MKIVPKTWGFEAWIVNTDLYCCKMLYVLKNRHCSVHHHIRKDETFFILGGLIWVDGEPGVNYVLPQGALVRIPPGEKHRFTAKDGDAVILEVSTTHADTDSVRATRSYRARPFKPGEVTSAAILKKYIIPAMTGR